MMKKVTWPINPERTALIVVDMQKLFCVEGEGLYVPDTVNITEFDLSDASAPDANYFSTARRTRRRQRYRADAGSLSKR